MFTGLIETTGAITAVTARGEGRVLRIGVAVSPLTEFGGDGGWTDLRAGKSISVSGCCLTVETPGAEGFGVFASPETLGRSTLGGLAVGARVNLERSLALGDRLGGHLVTGHVDAVGSVERLTRLGESWLLVVRFPPELAPLIVEKGSVAVDGVSLTSFDVSPATELRGDRRIPGRFSVALIPETMARTTIGDRRPGDAVNLEADLIGKYVVRQMTLRGEVEAGGVSEDLLRRAGYLAEGAEVGR